MRLFIAINLPDAVRRELQGAIGVLQKEGIAAKWVRPDNLHITLKFLGDVDSARVPGMVRILAEAARRMTPFSCQLDGFGIFPPRGRSRILYVATDQQERLKALADTLEEQLLPCGFCKEGRFKSHITLARFRQTAAGRVRCSALPPVPFRSRIQIAGCSLMESILTPAGARYREVAFFAFKE